MNTAEFDFWNGVAMHEEELSDHTQVEATKVFDEWQMDEEEMNIMEVDMQIGSNFLDEAIFDPCCASPVGPIEELPLVGMEDESSSENYFFSTDDSSSASVGGVATSLEFNEQYKATLQKLCESMKRSHETRKSLTMKTPKTEQYARSNSVSGVISSIERSSEQLQAYLMQK